MWRLIIGRWGRGKLSSESSSRMSVGCRFRSKLDCKILVTNRSFGTKIVISMDLRFPPQAKQITINCGQIQFLIDHLNPILK